MDMMLDIFVINIASSYQANSDIITMETKGI